MYRRQSVRACTQLSGFSKLPTGLSYSVASKKGDRLQGKVAIISGGGAGIGRASSLIFADQGCKVVVADKNEKAGQQTVELVKAQGGDATFVYVDVSKEKDNEDMVKCAEKTYGKLDILFNNAGIMHSDDNGAVDTEEKIWDLTMNINAKGVFLGCKYGIPALLRNGGGSVINVASFVAILGAATSQVAYTASKGAVLSLTRELAVIHARQNLRINALCPGPLKTELLMAFLNTEEKKQRRLVHVPMGRFGEAEEIARAALFLASDDSTYVTGSTFLVDGGITAAYVTPL